MYVVTLKKGYTEFEFEFGTWDSASEFMMVVLKSMNDIDNVTVEVSVKKGEE